MAAPFYNNIKGAASGTPGTGAFTPTSASTGYIAWSTVPTGWWGLVRYEDGSSWELSYSYWNGTTLSRSATQLVASSSGSVLSLGAGTATAAMVMDANYIQPTDVVSHRWLQANPSSATLAAYGCSAPTITGTAAAGTLSTGSMLGATPRVQLTSATTANATSAVAHVTQPIITSSVSGIGGFDVAWRFGCSVLPTGPRLAIGYTSLAATSFTGAVVEPSAVSGGSNHMFIKDSTDTNIQAYTNNGFTGTKVNTGIALVANGWYEARLWSLPGSLTCYFLLVRLDTGAIYYGSTTTTTPGTGIVPNLLCMAQLSSTTGTAVVLHVGSCSIRTGT